MRSMVTILSSVVDWFNCQILKNGCDIVTLSSKRDMIQKGMTHMTIMNGWCPFLWKVMEGQEDTFKSFGQ